MKTVSQNGTASELIRKLVAESPLEGGSIFLDDFCAQVPGETRADCVSALKNHRGILFVVGRKGHQSRAVWGALKDNYTQAPSFKSAMAGSGPIRHHTPHRQPAQHNNNQQPDNVTQLDASAFCLRVVVQGQEVFVPIDELELVPAKMAA